MINPTDQSEFIIFSTKQSLSRFVCKIMISLINSTHNTLNKLFDSFLGILDHDTRLIQDYYDSIIYNTDFSSILCTCGCSGWNIHSYYNRTLSLYEHNYTLTITRIQCRKCNCTHALLPSFITPHLQLATEDIIEVITSPDSITHCTYAIKNILRIFEAFYHSSIKPILSNKLNYSSFFSLVKRHRTLIVETT